MECKLYTALSPISNKIVRPFGTEERYESSIALDASTHGDVTVASAVTTTRKREVQILQSIVDAFENIEVEFIPFKTKSRRIDKEEHKTAYVRTIDANSSQIHQLQFHHSSAQTNQHYTEAVLTAILSETLTSKTDQNPLIIVDGDANKLDTFARAYYELGDELPEVTNCVQSERYYPQCLLADLSAGFVACQIDNDRYDYESPLLRAPAADTHFAEEWGRAFAYLQTNPDVSVERVPVKTGYSGSPGGRAEMWYSGRMGRNTQSRARVGLNTIISRIRDMGYPDVAEALEGL